VIKISVVTNNVEAIEALVVVAAQYNLNPSLGVVVEQPIRRPTQPGRQSTKRRTKKSRRRSSKMTVKLATLTGHVPPKAIEARTALEKHFGKGTFQKGEATRIVQEALKMKTRATGYVAMLMDAGGIVRA